MNIYMAITTGILIVLVVIIRQKIKAIRKEADEVLKEHEQSVNNVNIMSERAIKLGVLTAYLGAKDGHKEGQVLDMFLAELNSRDISAKRDIWGIKMQISAGFYMYKNNPGLTSDSVFNAALEYYHQLIVSD